jgi:hypothetical protein
VNEWMTLNYSLSGIVIGLNLIHTPIGLESRAFFPKNHVEKKTLLKLELKNKVNK